MRARGGTTIPAEQRNRLGKQALDRSPLRHHLAAGVPELREDVGTEDRINSTRTTTRMGAEEPGPILRRLVRMDELQTDVFAAAGPAQVGTAGATEGRGWISTRDDKDDGGFGRAFEAESPGAGGGVAGARGGCARGRGVAVRWWHEGSGTVAIRYRGGRPLIAIRNR